MDRDDLKRMCNVRLGITELDATQTTAERAVACMVNASYSGVLDLLEELEWAWHHADQDELFARHERKSKEELQILGIRRQAHLARYRLAKLLMAHVKQEIADPNTSLVIKDANTGVPLSGKTEYSSKPAETILSKKAVAEWARDQYQIEIAWLRETETTAKREKPDAMEGVSWDEVTVRIYEGFRIGYSSRLVGNKWATFQAIGLMGKRKNAPNRLGGILIGLSQGEKYPAGKAILNRDAASMVRLRSALRKLNQNPNDPFAPFNAHDGWKPRFTLIDATRVADERAEKRSIHVSLDEEEDYYHSGVDSERVKQWLDEND